MRVALADDSVLFREGLALLLDQAGFDVVGQAGDADGLVNLVRDERPDVAIVDIRMPPTHTNEGLVAAERIRAERPGVGLLVLSQYVEAAHALRLLRAAGGGTGYLLKDRVSRLDEFTDAVVRVGTGSTAVDPECVARLVARKRVSNPIDSLSDQERRVLALMAEGRSNPAIAGRMSLNVKTVESHVRSIFMKLDLPPETGHHRRVLAVLAYLART